MASHVIDLSSNTPENIALAAEVIGSKGARREVFKAIYLGKQKIKTVSEIADSTKLTPKRVLEVAKKLAVSNIVTQVKVKGRTAYQKIDFFHQRKAKILSLASSKKKLNAFPTKHNRGASGASKSVSVHIRVRIPKKRNRATHLTIDDIDNFAKVKSFGSRPNVKMPETKFKNGVAKILGEHGKFKDWGGETRDLSSNQLKIKGKRKIVAFAFKGPGKTGKLTPGKMGVNGDQIQRLVKCPAEVFIVQYWADIEDSVLEQLRDLVTLKSYFEDKELWYGIINGNDSARLITAYSTQFSSKKK
jgi:hypothetical protein